MFGNDTEDTILTETLAEEFRWLFGGPKTRAFNSTGNPDSAAFSPNYITGHYSSIELNDLVTNGNLAFRAALIMRKCVDQTIANPDFINMDLPKSKKKGDPNGDRVVNILDLLYASSLIGVTCCVNENQFQDFWCCDINDDNAVNILDIISITSRISSTI